MHYYLYEIRNNIDGKIYIGVHKTKVLDDGYMGSGLIIKRAIEKHGVVNFTKTILETFETQEEMFAREKEIVTEEFLLREDTYNLRRGGYGGWDYLNKTGKNLRTGMIHSEESKEKMSISCKKSMTQERKEAMSVRSSGENSQMKRPEIAKKVADALRGRNLSEDHKEKISQTLKDNPEKTNLGKKFPNRKKRTIYPQKIVECPHCGLIGKIGGMSKWHFENCKKLKDI